MADVFISYAHGDADIAAAVAAGVEQKGYTTWRYEDKSRLGGSYLERISREIRQCRAALFVISPTSLASPQCKAELIRAHELGKPLLPLRRGISHDDLVRASDEWGLALKGAVTAEVTPETAAAMADEAVAVLHEQSIEPATAPTAATLPTSPLRRLSRGAVHGIAPADISLGAAVAGIIGVLGILYTFYHLGHALSPPRDAEGWVMMNFGSFRTATALVNLIGLVQNILLVYGARLAYRRDPRAGPFIRKVALSMLVAIGVWLLVAFASFSGRSVPNGAALLGQAFYGAVVAAVPAGIVYGLFRRSGRTQD